MVPHLITSFTGPLPYLERHILERRPEIERWLRSRFAEHEVPFYTSVDLCNGGSKLAPVGTNLFPGGFNNLNPDFLPLCVHAAMSAIQNLCPDAERRSASRPTWNACWAKSARSTRSTASPSRRSRS
jgi:glutamate--cysteine ligase